MDIACREHRSRSRAHSSALLDPHPVEAAIALGWLLVYFKLSLRIRSHHEASVDAYRFWVKVFAPSFAMGRGLGCITMSFQFGTYRSRC